MSTVVALIDGEHYPPVVRSALAALSSEFDVVTAAFVGGTEKVDAGQDDVYGVPVVRGASAAEALIAAIERYQPHAVVDLSDEPVLSADDRFRLASIALAHGVEYRGADFVFMPPRAKLDLRTPALAIIGTGKRVGKTAVSAHVARELKGRGVDVAVVAMGRGGPVAPELIRGDEVELTTADLLALARQGKHAASDNYEDAMMSRVTTVGCRRCGGGLAGETFFSNVAEGARLADTLGKDLVILEGSGAAIPPVAADATLLVVGAGQGPRYVEGYFGPFRLARADGVVIAGAEEPVATPAEVDELVTAIRSVRPDVPVVRTVFRPRPLQPIEGARVFFASTAPPALLDHLARHLEASCGCTVVATSSNLSNRAALRDEVAAAAGVVDVFVTELKAAAVDVVAALGDELGVPTILADNVPEPVGGDGFDGLVCSLHELARARGAKGGG
ncbi:MAG: 2,3-diphosphoglycerate synthetase [Coriobacteriia bacterium]|nr:2,3-diphosphoglycerate synthetase [Coriobacteriia bacterium]